MVYVSVPLVSSWESGLEPWRNMLYKNTTLPTELIPKRTNDDTARIAAPSFA